MKASDLSQNYRRIVHQIIYVTGLYNLSFDNHMTEDNKSLVEVTLKHGDLHDVCDVSDSEDQDGVGWFGCVTKMNSDFQRAEDSVRSRAGSREVHLCVEEVLLQLLKGPG